MPIDVVHDDLIALEAVAKQFPGRDGTPRSLKSIMRWVLHGIKGGHDGAAVKLEAKRVGGSWYTTEDAIRRFSDATTKQSIHQPCSEKRPHPKAKKKHSAAHQRAVSKLRASGMGKRS